MPLDIPLPTASPFDDIEQYIPLLLSSVDNFLCAPDVWSPGDEEQGRLYCEDLKEWIVTELPLPATIYPHRADLHPATWHVLTGSAWSFTAGAGIMNGGTWRQASSANTNRIVALPLLDAGTYKLHLVYATRSDGGIVHIFVDSVEQGTGKDTYTAGQVLNVHTSQSFTQAEPGRPLIELRSSTKNAASSAFFLYLSHAWIEDLD